MKSTIPKLPACTNSKVARRVAGCCVLLVSLSVVKADFTWPVYEPFGEYTQDPQRLGTRLTPDQSGTNWNIGNNASHGPEGTDDGVSSFIISNGVALSYPALVPDTNDVPKGVQAVPQTGSADRGGLITPQTGTWYASFILNYQDNGGATIDRSIFQLGTGGVIDDSITRVYTAVWLTPDYRLRVTKNYNEANLMSTADFSDPTPVVSTNVQHLIVMRYLKVPGGQDIVNLWVDPAPFGDDATMPPPMITTSNAANIDSFDAVALSNRKLNGAAGVPPNIFQVDEIRLGDTWSSVTPLATPAPGPMFAVTGGGIGCPGDDIHVGLSGSVSTNDYLLYTNAVYATTFPGTGAALDFGMQTTLGTYSVLASNTVTADFGWMSNSVYVAVTDPPFIVTEPRDMVTTPNNWAEFRAEVTGDDLGFQWYRGATALADDAHLVGAATDTLVISPVTAADVDNYHVVITNRCGFSTTSATASLSLHAPDDLVWGGDAFDINNWDVYAANAEWIGGTGYFNPGDNVTFDDTYTYADNITLNGYLTPSKITVNASRDYTFAGSGTIAGDGMLVKDGTGALFLNANRFVNSYTGGTIISNGTVNITNGWNNLGTGPVTLAGGTLESWNKGNGYTTGLPGDLHVTADSTWQIDRSGDQCAGLLGGLIGNPGTTLTLSNSWVQNDKLNRIRIVGPFTNESAIVATVNAVNTNSWLEVGSYNPVDTVQVYNGPISGETAFLVVGGGAAYLNAANTYTRDTTTYVGLLAGSGSIDGQLVVNAGTTVGGGAPDAIGTFTVNSNITLNGNVLIRVDKSLAQSNDLIVATGTIANGGTGTVTITNIGVAPLAVGDKFQIFSGAVANGAALNITGGGMGWSNNLEVDGSIVAMPGIAGYSTNISYSVGDGTLTITWPETHLGWILQSQTNSLGVGLTTNGWYDIPDSASGTTNSMSVDAADPTVFYRLRHP